MEDYFKDFEYYGFDSELEMVKTIVDWAAKTPSSYEKSFKEITEEWITINPANEPGSLVSIPGNGTVADL